MIEPVIVFLGGDEMSSKHNVENIEFGPDSSDVPLKSIFPQKTHLFAYKGR